MKYDDLHAVDTAALSRPWSWCDGTLLWNEEADHCVLSHGGTRWPISPENRAAIESAMNHMPALISLVADVERLQDAMDRAVDVPKMSQAIHSVMGALALVHAVPPPAPSGPVAWDPDSGRPINTDLAASAAMSDWPTGKLVDLDELESSARDAYAREISPHSGVSPDRALLAVIERVREVEQIAVDALNHLSMSVKVARDERIMEVEEANDERRWIKAQAEILKRGAVLP